MASKLTDTELLQALTEVFRTHGFEGTTLAMVSEATGLQKSSLYHRFPDGKEQMVTAVLDAAGEHLATHVLAPLRGTGSLRNRVKETALRLGAFYHDGHSACLLDTVSVGTPTPAIAQQLGASYEALEGAFGQIAREAGLPPATARSRARDALVRLEGSLVVARVSQDRKVFEDFLRQLPDLLCEP